MFRKDKLLSRAARVALYPLIFLPAALALLYVYSFGVSVVFGDQWAEMHLFRKLDRGNLGVSDLFYPHNEHRIFFPRVVMLSLGTITGLNNLAEMYFTQVLLLTMLIVLLLAFKRSIGTTLFLFVPISFLVFSLRQEGNMLMGFQMALVLLQTFSVLTFYLLYVLGQGKFKRLAFPGALVSGTVAAFSALPGLFVWPVGLLQLLVGPIEKPAKKVLAGVWGLAGVVVWVVYFIDFDRFSSDSTVGYLLDNPVVGVRYFITFLGGSMFSSQQEALAFVSGLLLISFAVAGLLFAYRDGKLGENSFWIALVLYTFLVAASVTLGRAERDIEGALGSRYATFSVLAAVGVYAMLVKLAFERKSYPTGALLGILSVVILVSIPFSYSYGIKQGVRNEAQKEKAAYILSTYESQSDESLVEGLQRKRPEQVRERAPDLERLGYNVFSES